MHVVAGIRERHLPSLTQSNRALPLGLNIHNNWNEQKCYGHAVLSLNINNKVQHSGVIATVACVQLMEDAERDLLGGSSGYREVEQLMH
eukprot:3336446-Rhodomonas_salina.1